MISAPLQKAFMLLLRQGLWDRQEDCSALFPLDEKEWNEIHSMAKKTKPYKALFTMASACCRLKPYLPGRYCLAGWWKLTPWNG